MDDARLQEVLDFNANDPRKNWKSKKAVAEREKGSAVKAKKAAAVKEEEQEGDEVVKSGKARRGKAAAGPAPAAATRKPAAHRKKVISESETETSAGTVICK